MNEDYSRDGTKREFDRFAIFEARLFSRTIILPSLPLFARPSLFIFQERNSRRMKKAARRRREISSRSCRWSERVPDEGTRAREPAGREAGQSRRDVKSRGMRATERIDLSAELWHGTTTRDNLPRRACRCFRHHHHHHHHRRRLYNRYSCRVGDGACRSAGDAAATSTTLFRPRSSLRGVRELTSFVFIDELESSFHR